MSEVTRTLHRKNYDAISASSPAQSQAGRTVLITGSSGGIGLAVARAYITAGAKTVVITSRTQEKALRTALELQTSSQGRSQVVGFQLELNDEKSVGAVWDGLRDTGVRVDVLVLCTSESLTDVQICEFWHHAAL